MYHLPLKTHTWLCCITIAATHRSAPLLSPLACNLAITHSTAACFVFTANSNTTNGSKSSLFSDFRTVGCSTSSIFPLTDRDLQQSVDLDLSCSLETRSSNNADYHIKSLILTWKFEEASFTRLELKHKVISTSHYSVASVRTNCSFDINYRQYKEMSCKNIFRKPSSCSSKLKVVLIVEVLIEVFNTQQSKLKECAKVKRCTDNTYTIIPWQCKYFMYNFPGLG